MSKMNVRTCNSTAANGGHFRGERARGTQELQELVQTNDILGGLILSGHDGTSFVETSQVLSAATEYWSPGSTGGDLSFWTTENGTTGMTQRLHVSHEGNVGVGVTDSTYKFEVDGHTRIAGNLYVDGTSFISMTETVEIEDNLLIINKGESGAGVTAGTAGIQVDRGSLTDYQFLFDETQDNFRVGELGSLQAVATREDSPTDTGLAFWNDAQKRFDTDTGLTYTGGRLSLTSGTGINEFTTDVNLGDGTASDDAVPTEYAVKTYVDNAIAGASTPPGGSSGMVQYNDAGSFGGESELFWNATSNRLGIRTDSPSYALDVKGEGNFYDNVYIGTGDTTAYLTIGVGTAINEFSTDGTFADNSDDALPTEKAVKTYVDQAIADATSHTYWQADAEGITYEAGKISLASGTGINEISTSITLGGAGSSDDAVATQLPIKTYVDNALEDYIQGDSELYWDDVNHRLGIRTDSPSYALDVKGDANFYDSIYIGVGDTTAYINLGLGTSINEFSTDGTLGDNSDDALPTEQAVKTYVDLVATDLTAYVDAQPTASPGGTDGAIQYNNGGDFGGEAELYWNDTNNSVGIRTNSPSYALDVNGDARVESDLFIGIGDNTAYVTIGLGTNINEFSTDGTLAGNSDDALPTEQAVKTYVDNAVSTSANLEDGTAAGQLTFWDGVDTWTYTSTSELSWEDTNKNFGIGTPDQFAGGSGVVGIANSLSVPNTDPTGGGVMYVEDGAAKWRSPSGTITTFGPADPHCPVCGKDFMLEFANGDDYLAMCMSCLSKELGQRDWVVTK